jgi:ribosomal protein L16/L10AE
MILKTITNGAVVRVGTLEAAAEAMARARTRGADFDCRACPDYPRSARERDLTAAEASALVQLAARILIEEGTA